MRSPTPSPAGVPFSPVPGAAYAVGGSTGNGNGGHEYGTPLGGEERWDLVEYLESL